MARKSKSTDSAGAETAAPKTRSSKKTPTVVKLVPNPVAAPVAVVAPVELAKTPKPEKGDKADKGDRGDGPLRLRDLLGAISERCTGVKKSDLRVVVDATLAEIGASLHKGQGLNLPGLGKAKIAKRQDKDGKSVLTVKIQQGEGKKAEPTPLADDDD